MTSTRTFRGLALRRVALACLLSAAAALPAHAADNPKAGKFYEDALTRYEKKDYAGAIIQLKNALKIDKNMLPVQVLLGNALLANNEVVAAEVAFNEALRLGVNRVEVVVPLAKAVMGQGKRQPLLDDPRFSLEGLPPNLRQQMLLQVAVVHTDLGRSKEALKAIEDARAISGAGPETWLAEVPIRIRARQYAEAAVAADKAVALSPGSADALYMRGSVFHTQGNLPKAVEAYTKALELQPTHMEALLARAGIAVDQLRNADAKRDLEAARKNDAKDPRAFYLTAVIAGRDGDEKTVKSSLAEVTNLLDPVPIEFMRYRQQVLILGGLAHHGLGQREKAKPYLEAVQREQPNSPVSKLLGEIHLADNNVDRAIESLDAYLRSYPTDVQALSLLASAHMSQGRHARAAQIMQDALKVQDKPALRTILGLSLVRGGKVAEATTELETAYAKDPGQVQAGVALVDLYLAARKPKKAVETAESLVKRLPNQAAMHNLLGTARNQAGETAKARSAFEQAVKLDARFVDPQLNLARMDIAARQLDAAVARLNAITKINEKHVPTLMEASRVAGLRGQPDEAARLLTRAADLSTGPADTQAVFELFELHLRAGRLEGAQEALKRLQSKAPEDTDVLIAAARLALAGKNTELARTALVRASRQAGFEPAVQTKIALLQIGAGDAKNAAYTLSKALQGDPKNLPALALLTDAEIRLGEYTPAEQRARDIASRYPKLAVGHSLVGDVAMARGQQAAAIDAYRKAHATEPSSSTALRLYRALGLKDPAAAQQVADQWLRTRPQDVVLRRAVANTQASAGNAAAAKASYEMLLKAAPKDAEALNNYAHVLLALNDPAGANRAATAALGIKPDVPYIIGTAGWTAFKAGEADRGLQLLRTARLRDPENADTRYFLAAALAAAGRYGEAREELRTALKAGTNFASAKDAQALLNTLK